MNDDAKLTIRLPKELLDAFDRATVQMDRNKSQIVRDLLREFLAKNRQPRLPL